MKNRTPLILFLTLVLFACKKEDKPYVLVQRCTDLTRNRDTINLFIHGTWNWVEELRVTSEYGVQYFTPYSPKFHHIRLELLGETAKFFVDNKPDSVYRFKIQRELEITNYPSDSLPVIAYYSFYTGQRRSYVPILICKDQLLMQHQFVSSIVGERLWIRK